MMLNGNTKLKTNMDNENLKLRTRKFALDIIKLVESLPNDRVSNVIGNQLLRAGTSVGANYRAATRAKSPADFIAKMGIVEEESDESAFWMDLPETTDRLDSKLASPLIKEAGELTAIAVASIRTARRNAADSKINARTTTVPRSAFLAPRSR
jgi:four helix bundle protein